MLRLRNGWVSAGDIRFRAGDAIPVHTVRPQVVPEHPASFHRLIPSVCMRSRRCAAEARAGGSLAYRPGPPSEPVADVTTRAPAT